MALRDPVAVPGRFARHAGPVLAAPGQDDRHEQRRAYWASLLYLLVYRLGWTDPGQGLTNWLDADCPDLGDPTPRLVADVWGRDGRLPLARAFLLSKPRPFAPTLATVCGLPRPEPSPPPELTGRERALLKDPLGLSGLHLDVGDGGHLGGPDEHSWPRCRSRTPARRSGAESCCWIPWRAGTRA